MAPKRKASTQDRTKTKTPSPVFETNATRTAKGAAKSRSVKTAVVLDTPPVIEVEDPTARQVDWVMPMLPDNTTLNDSNEITQFAHPLYSEEWGRIVTKWDGFQSAHIRSPFQERNTLKDMVVGPKRPEVALVQLYNRIKHDTENTETSSTSVYARSRFTNAFGTPEDAFAVVASAANVLPILALGSDYRVEVTVRHSDSDQQTARATFIRRSSPAMSNEEPASRSSYFVELPTQTAITINGRSYTNNTSAPDHVNRPIGSEQRVPAPFIIGPLEEYTVIEILSQPTFFFQTKDDLSYSKRSYPKADLNPMRTDHHGHGTVVEVVWRPIQAAPPRPTSPHPDPQPKQPNSDSTDTKEESWTNDTEAGIENPQDYIRSCLWAQQRDRYYELIPRVLASINHRQSTGSGFSFIYEGQTFRPGRTLITAIPHDKYHVLVITRKNDKSEELMHILDPMAWKSNLEARENLVATIKKKTNSGEDVHSPGVSWASCAQHTHDDNASTYTILNAWAIALGLQVNPDFTANGLGENFFTQAQWLFGLAVQDRLDWRLLLAFFKTTQFVMPAKGDENAEHNADADLPEQGRRFTQTKRTFERAIDEQCTADAASQTSSKTIQTTYLSANTGVSRPFTSKFSIDDIPEDSVDAVSKMVGQGHWTWSGTFNEIMERIGQPISTQNDLTDKSSTGQDEPPKHGTALGKKTAATATVFPDQFDPCDFLIEKLKSSATTVEATAPKPSSLNDELFHTSIIEVARLINLLHPEGKGIAVASFQDNASTESPKLHDPFLPTPWLFSNHTVLVAVKAPAVATKGQKVQLYVFDSAPWTLDVAKRNQFRTDIGHELAGKWYPRKKTVQLSVEMIWVLGPCQKDLWQSRYYPVVNAWALLLGCTPRREFAPQPEFFSEVHKILELLLTGNVDWRLLYAFLRCHQFIEDEGLPEKGRWFVQGQSASGNIAPPSEESDSEIVEPLSSYNFSQRFKAIYCKPHNRSFSPYPFVDWDETDTTVRAPALGRIGAKIESMTSAQLKEAYRELTTKLLLTKQPVYNGSNPCTSLRNRLHELKSDEGIRQRLGSLRSQARIEDKAGNWLADEDIVSAVASITLAITKLQDVNHGFSAITSIDVGISNRTDKDTGEFDGPTIVPRFCRPMFVPVVHLDHIVLAVVQLDESEKLTISILDSKSSHYSRPAREKVFAMVMETVWRTHWWRQRFNNWGDVPQPKVAKWIPCAQQPADDECGYYTIIHSWALALGLEVNPYAAPVWDQSAAGIINLFQTVLDIAYLAQLGMVDWRLIYDFLRCHRFVIDGEVPQDRRFTQSVNLEAENTLRNELSELAANEMVHWTSGSASVEEIKGSNFIRLPQGIDHTASFSRHDWTGTKKDNAAARELSGLGQLYFATSKTEFRHLYDYFCENPPLQNSTTGERLGRDKAAYILRSLEWQRGDISSIPREHLFEQYRNFLRNKRSQTTRLRMFNKKTCALAAEGLGRLQALLDDPHVDQHFADAVPNSRKEKYLDLGEVNIAVAAVVEAVDRHQASRHAATHESPFTGGFAVATSAGLKLARYRLQEEGSISRPRRLFLLSMTITAGEIREAQSIMITDEREAGRGHHFLAVVQEEDREPLSHHIDERHFCIYTLDSAPRRFVATNIQNLFRTTIQNIATNLGWSMQPNTSTPFGFREQHTQVPVFPQEGGGWQCGLHTILYAWILALGLIPREGPLKLQDHFYDELWILIRAAIAGLLDWQTLVAWLFCHSVTTSRELSSVHENRRFETTQYQDALFMGFDGEPPEFAGEIGLTDRVRNIFEGEKKNIAKVSETRLPYDCSNNIKIASTGSHVAAVAGVAGADGGIIPEGDGERDNDSIDEKSDKEQDEDEDGNGEDCTDALSEILGFAQGSEEYEILRQCTEEEHRVFVEAPEDQRSTLLEEFQLNILTRDPGAGLNRSCDDAGIFWIPGHKRKAFESLNRSYDDMDVGSVRKKLKRSQSSKLKFLNEVDADGDVQMVGSPWRKRQLAFLKAF